MIRENIMDFIERYEQLEKEKEELTQTINQIGAENKNLVEQRDVLRERLASHESSTNIAEKAVVSNYVDALSEERKRRIRAEKEIARLGGRVTEIISERNKAVEAAEKQVQHEREVAADRVARLKEELQAERSKKGVERKRYIKTLGALEEIGDILQGHFNDEDVIDD